MCCCMSIVLVVMYIIELLNTCTLPCVLAAQRDMCILSNVDISSGDSQNWAGASSTLISRLLPSAAYLPTPLASVFRRAQFSSAKSRLPRRLFPEPESPANYVVNKSLKQLLMLY